MANFPVFIRKINFSSSGGAKLGLTEALILGERDGLRLWEGLTLELIDGERLGLGLTLELIDGLIDFERLGESETEMEGEMDLLTEGLKLWDGETLWEIDLEIDGLNESDTEGLMLFERLGLKDGESEAEGEIEVEIDFEILGLRLADGEMEELILPEIDGEILLESDGLNDGERDSLPALGEGEILAESDFDMEGLMLGERLWEGEILELIDGERLKDNE